ncbi:hypothetical protein EIB18_14310 [Caulobacter vibrioides]|uniref:Uncharacterized protein n=2 Tax=Caulobacter vibrioides TaxID=155892 RepID=Q9A4X6_CAUVC|nr:hypothetical protein [Caulobacter vibrioides]YP_002518155.1 hypothetical protein CCNA_02782 [Caulobacter vibrioides NA1000]AAK24664.1 hypothetical protein CC_2699 [Caulobacter vibrioides CB15]ACL96247.1 hypothetical protein CCNA_02782 [Caulobacter vibrioides NA1000]ATC29535.1 hypothetical protein CA607_14585 [Caulobacter vibrioides]AZH13767.1 hypothetical protein EIB18_14310 [Caulobacter vibrioides]QXZ51056.1 hypothetical protein KZH45_14340 [Caulobacter vibrioides]
MGVKTFLNRMSRWWSTRCCAVQAFDTRPTALLPSFVSLLTPSHAAREIGRSMRQKRSHTCGWWRGGLLLSVSIWGAPARSEGRRQENFQNGASPSTGWEGSPPAAHAFAVISRASHLWSRANVSNWRRPDSPADLGSAREGSEPTLAPFKDYRAGPSRSDV